MKYNTGLKWINTDVIRNIESNIMKYIFKFTKPYWSTIPNFVELTIYSKLT